MSYKETVQKQIDEPTTDLKALALALAKTLDHLIASNQPSNLLPLTSLFYEDIINPPVKFRP